MVKAKTVARIDRLRLAVGVGCPSCHDRTRVHLIGRHDPVPLSSCTRCGRVFDDEVYVYLGIDLDDI